jgi:hypothetical protein
VRAGPHRHTGGRVSMTGASIKLPAPRRRRTPGGKEVPAAAQRGAGFGDAHERRSSEPANCATANRQASSRVSARLRIATRPMLNYELPRRANGSFAHNRGTSSVRQRGGRVARAGRGPGVVSVAT